MTTIKIDIPDHRAAARGLTLEDWISRKLTGEDEEQSPAKPLRSPQAAAHILELQKRVKPDPEGWTVKDYINYGRPWLPERVLSSSSVGKTGQAVNRPLRRKVSCQWKNCKCRRLAPRK
jgi:hypothetical protein